MQPGLALIRLDLDDQPDRLGWAGQVQRKLADGIGQPQVLLAHPIQTDDQRDRSLYALKNAAAAAHPNGGMQTARYCICGHHSGGPAGRPLCRALADYLNHLGLQSGAYRFRDPDA